MMTVYLAMSLGVISFFVIGIYATYFMLTTPKQQLASKSWPIKMFWWVGAYFVALIVGGSILGFAILLAVGFSKMLGV